MRKPKMVGMNRAAYENIITMEPGKMGGKPCIRGHRFTVRDVFDYLASGMTEQELIAEFDFLTHEDILACYAFDGRRIKRKSMTAYIQPAGIGVKTLLFDENALHAECWIT